MIKELDKKYVADTYSRLDVLFVRGKGSTLFDETGKKYIDFTTGVAVNGLGIANKAWVKAVTKQLKKLPHTSNWYYNEPSAVLAKLLCEKTNMKNVFFSNSGAEANETAIKAARKYHFDKGNPDRYEIITLNQSFHGRTMGAVSATGQPGYHKGFMPVLDGFLYADANDFDSILKAVNKKTAAIMIELVQGEGGVNVMEKDFMTAVSKLCEEKDIILIIDEVQTGNGRTGTLYAYTQYDLKPDIVTTAKGLGNGLPIGVTFLGEKAEKTFEKGSHGSTFGANAAVCAGAIEVLRQIDQKMLDGVKAKREKIVDAIKDLPKVKAITGLGLMIGIKCENSKSLMVQCLEKGLAVLTAKEDLRLLPALNISDKELNEGIEILKEVLS